MTLQEITRRNEIVLKNALLVKEMLEKCPCSSLEEVDNAILFYSLITSLSAQAKAPASETFVCKKLALIKIPAKENRGDAKDKNGLYYELKNSFTNVGQNLNLRQIRLWQPVDYYIVFYIDEEEITNSIFFKLTKEEMTREVELMGGYTHGTISANQDNKNIEYSITLDLKTNNNNLNRWKAQYLSVETYDKVMN